MSLLSQFYPSGGGSGGGGVPLDMLIIGGGGGSGASAGSPSPDGSFTSCSTMGTGSSGLGAPGGLYEVYEYPAAPGKTYPITVGSGGAGGTGAQNGGTRGSNGGTSAFNDPEGSRLEATGGGGGGVLAVANGFQCCCYPAFTADPTITYGRPGGSGGGGMSWSTNAPPQPQTIRCYANGGVGEYQGDMIQNFSWGACTLGLSGASFPVGKKTRWGSQRGNSQQLRYFSSPYGNSCNVIVGGVGGQIANLFYSKNPCQLALRPSPTAQGYCNDLKYPCAYTAHISNITGFPACYGGARPGSVGVVTPGAPLTSSSCFTPLIPQTCCAAPHPTDAGYGLGGISICAVLTRPTPGQSTWYSGPGLSGSSGSVTLRYPTSWGATPGPNRSGSTDCSPLTPGYYTYTWKSPGSITLP